MAKMNRVLGFDENYGILKCEAGLILENANSYVGEKRYVMPLYLGARGSCHVGGNISTNAGGSRFIKYNSMHANTVGLKCVLPDGKVIDDMKGFRKDNTGYDLKHLFIGSEGTLGIITEAAVLCHPEPKGKNLAMLGCKSFENVIEILKIAK